VSARRAIICIDGQRAGILEETERGSRFTYDAAWLARLDAVAVSLTMPLRTEPYDGRGLLPFFENLLPEGWLLELSLAKLKIAKDDAFGLLLATCADCVGAVEVIDASASDGERGQGQEDV
jgi:serine/threonine-protein kinase HipA